MLPSSVSLTPASTTPAPNNVRQLFATIVKNQNNSAAHVSGSKTITTTGASTTSTGRILQLSPARIRGASTNMRPVVALPPQNIILQESPQFAQTGCLVRGIIPNVMPTTLHRPARTASNVSTLMKTVVQLGNQRLVSPICLPLQPRIVLASSSNAKSTTLLKVMKSPNAVHAPTITPLKTPTIKTVGLSPCGTPQQKQNCSLTSSGDLHFPLTKPSGSGMVIHSSVNCPLPTLTTSTLMSKHFSATPTKGVSLLTGQPAFLSHPQPMPIKQQIRLIKGSGNIIKVCSTMSHINNLSY